MSRLGQGCIIAGQYVTHATQVLLLMPIMRGALTSNPVMPALLTYAPTEFKLCCAACPCMAPPLY